MKSAGIRRRIAVFAASALAVAVPVSFALAQGGSESTIIEASECDPEAVQVLAEKGLAADGFSPACLTVEQAQATVDEVHPDRVKGLMHLVETIRQHGQFPEDQADLDAAEAELEKVGGPDPALSAEVEREVASLMTLEEFEQHRAAQLGKASRP